MIHVLHTATCSCWSCCCDCLFHVHAAVVAVSRLSTSLFHQVATLLRESVIDKPGVLLCCVAGHVLCGCEQHPEVPGYPHTHHKCRWILRRLCCCCHELRQCAHTTISGRNQGPGQHLRTDSKLQEHSGCSFDIRAVCCPAVRCPHPLPEPPMGVSHQSATQPNGRRRTQGDRVCEQGHSAAGTVSVQLHPTLPQVRASSRSPASMKARQQILAPRMRTTVWAPTPCLFLHVSHVSPERLPGAFKRLNQGALPERLRCRDMLCA